ncbi:energy-coupling factor transporter ATP-binding protein EcfA2 [Nocardioides thalensis]|uniref:Energy-coupling factor transporter ATP-binding protein EcfA2 n=1 Tax=Nocardioides thalensis TaxID=1914755 RepID=A0A853BVP6_9ACTN|nr:AAA family ATPase [Nocardioides thalensis]NYI99949.1 energy-coupling factor transporter ATP-binding protein EcfA2 [Nocardioides thalensis]
MHGLGIGGYRSMPDLRWFSPLGKVTLLAGQNNVGKSNVIRFLERYMRSQSPRRGWEDEPRAGGEPLKVAIGYRLDQDSYEGWVGQAKNRTDAFLSLAPFHPLVNGDLFWVVRSQGDRQQTFRGDQPVTAPWQVDPEWMASFDEAATGKVNLTNLRQGLFSTSGGSPADNIKAIVDHLFPFEPPPVQIIHAFRQVTSGSDESDYSGRNLIETLADHQNPDVRERSKEEKFRQINRFLQTVLEDPTVRIEVPSRRDYIMVHQDGMVLPLGDLGTGIHQAVIMAAAATLIDNSLVCIEEPEVNLHPLLQRKFVRYLTENTTNQYIIATHSAHMLDYERASVIHVRKDTSGSVPAPATTTHQFADICADLGYRPSDIMQANAIVWVEGPSDRTYINHWLRLYAPDTLFVEGIHYSIMFYGGSNRSHLTGHDPLDDETVNDLISLRRLNRHSMIVIDSDKTRPKGDKLDANKVRVRDEFDAPDRPGHAWVTACRTIENYVPADLLTEAVAAAHPHARYRPPATKWDDPLDARRKTDSRRATIDKVKVAHRVIERWTDETPLPDDLRREIRRLHEFISQANPSAYTAESSEGA